MTLDDIMKLNDEELMLMVAELQGHKNLQWMPQPFEEKGKILIDRDNHKPILNPINNIIAAWELWREMNYREPYQWAIFGDGDGEISIEYFSRDYKGDRKQGSGLWSIVGPDTITITRAYIYSRLKD